MSIYKELSYDQDIDTVKGIQFSVLSPEEIVNRSVVEVTKSDTFTGNEPVPGGLFDPRMGTLEYNKLCRTCEQKNIFCPGHFGHIRFARPVFNVMFYDIIRKALRCVCYRCSKILVSPDGGDDAIVAAAGDENSGRKDDKVEKARKLLARKIPNHKRWEAMSELCGKVKKCGECGAKQPAKYTKDGILKIMAEWKDGTETTTQEVTPEDAIRVFARMTDKDIEALGFSPVFNRPEWMVMTVMPVPPPAVRPSVTNENGQRCEDDLTHKLCDIVKVNNQLRAKIEKTNTQNDQVGHLTQLLQYHVATFMDNHIPNLPPAQQRNGRRLKSISDRLKKKEGRIRGNLNGKRVDQSARTVITPDPYISIDELGVPIKIAMNLTYPEVVNEYNKEELLKMVHNGPDVYPGAKYIRKKNQGNTIMLRRIPDRESIVLDRGDAADSKTIVLEEGDIVDRHLRDGDYVLFNRQPSLHKMSMMTHKVRVMEYQTFRLNPTVCSP